MTPSRSLRRRLVVAAALTAPATLLAFSLPGAAGASPGPHAGRTLTTTMTGAEEAPHDGDSDGSGTASLTINLGQRTLCYELTAVDIAPATAAHVHVAPLEVAGPVVIPLAAPTTGASSGCVSNLDRDLLRDLLTDPGAYYVNVHNNDFRPGAIRGQLGD